MDETRKLIVYAVLGAVFVVGLLGKLAFNDLFGTSTLVLWAPLSGDANVSIDGEAPVVIPAGRSMSFEKRRGTHEVVSTVNGEAFTTSVKLAQGGPAYAVPTSKSQCFALADVTRLFAHSTILAQARTSKRTQDSLRAKLDKRITSHKAEKLPPNTYLGVESLPVSRKAGGSVFVVQAFDCDEMKVGDGDVLALMRLN